MVANRHTCCICHEQRHPVEKHHINGDPSDNAWDNLAVTCRNCHGLVTAKGNLGAHYNDVSESRFRVGIFASHSSSGGTAASAPYWAGVRPGLFTGIRSVGSFMGECILSCLKTGLAGGAALWEKPGVGVP